MCGCSKVDVVECLLEAGAAEQVVYVPQGRERVREGARRFERESASERKSENRARTRTRMRMRTHSVENTFYGVSDRASKYNIYIYIYICIYI